MDGGSSAYPVSGSDAIADLTSCRGWIGLENVCGTPGRARHSVRAAFRTKATHHAYFSKARRRARSDAPYLLVAKIFNAKDAEVDAEERGGRVFFATFAKNLCVRCV